LLEELAVAMPSELPIAGVNQDLGRKVEEPERELRKAHRREAVAAEVFKAISRSASEQQPALETLVKSAV
jgi:hypothetical protein